MEDREDKKTQDTDFIDCDCPTYGVVKACENACKDLCLERPMDVRWENWERACKDRDPSKPNICVICSGGIGPLKTWQFIYKSQKKVVYSVTQCGKCKTIYWK